MCKKTLSFTQPMANGLNAPEMSTFVFAKINHHLQTLESNIILKKKQQFIKCVFDNLKIQSTIWQFQCLKIYMGSLQSIGKNSNIKEI